MIDRNAESRGRRLHRALYGSAAMLALTGSLGGCHLYDAGNQTLAQSTQTSFKDAKIGQTMAEERELSKAMLESEIAAVRREVEAMRDEALTRIVDQRWEVFDKDVNWRIERLTGKAPIAAAPAAPDKHKGGAPPPPVGVAPDKLVFDADTFANLARQELVAKKGLEKFLQTYAVGSPSAPMPSCPPEGALPPYPKDADTDYKDAFSQACNGYRAQHKAYMDYAAGLGGMIGGAEKERLAQEKLLASWKNHDAKDAKKNYDEAQQAYVQAKAEAGSTPAQKALTKIDDALKKVQSTRKALLDKLAALTGKSPYAALAAVDARYEGLTDVIDRILAGTPAKDSGFELVVSAALSLEKIEAERTLPPLLLEAERLRGELAVASARVSHAEKQLALLDAREQALLVQLDELIQARGARDRTKTLVVLADKTESRRPKAPESKAANKALESAACVKEEERVFESFDRSKDACRDEIAHALLHYANSWTLGELRSRVVRKMVNGDRHDEAIDLSAAAMQAWENVLAVPVDLVVKYHSGGVKPELAAQVAQTAVQLGGLGALTTVTGLKK